MYGFQPSESPSRSETRKEIEMTADTTQDGRRARLRHRANLAEARRMPKMTPDEIEQERADLLAEIEADGPLTEDQKRRIAAVAAADAAQPWTALEEALAEFLGETVALSDRGTLPPGLDSRVVGETVEITTRGAVVGTVNRQALADRAAQIEIDRRRD
jgi:hypothetical protein